MDLTMRRTVGSSELASSTVNSFICFFEAKGTLRTKHSTDLASAALLHDRISGFRLRHVITSTRANLQPLLLSFGVGCLYPQGQFMHPPIVLFIFSQREAETVARVEIADHARQTRAV